MKLGYYKAHDIPFLRHLILLAQRIILIDSPRLSALN